MNRGDNLNGNGDGGDDVINSGTGGLIPISDDNFNNFLGGGDGGDDVINSGTGDDTNIGDNSWWW